LNRLRRQLREKQEQAAQLSSLAENRLHALRELEANLHRQAALLASVDGSLGWQLLKPVRKLRRMLGGLFGEVDAKPVPHHQISVRDDAWESWGNDPQCLLPRLEHALHKGWYWVELRARTDLLQAEAKFFFDFGQGYNEEDAFLLAYRHDLTARRLVWVRARPKRVRLDPMESPGRFAIDQLRFTRVAGKAVADGMLRRLAERHPLFEGVPPRQIQARVKVEADSRGERFVEKLYGLYRETFDFAHRLRVTYAEWLENHDWPEYLVADAIRLEREGFALQPRFSVVMVATAADAGALERSLESLLAQTYPHWELLVVMPSPSAPDRARLLATYAARETRLHPLTAEPGASYAVAANHGLQSAGGDYCLLLEPDDQLSPHAFHALAKAVNAVPGARLLYSDEDRLDQDGRRFAPHFKPDWNPDLFLSHNYVSRAVAYPTGLMRELGGMRAGFDDAEGYDLLLRISERLRPEEIAHIPKILYHRRIRDESGQAADESAARAGVAGLRALREHLARLAYPAEAAAGPVSGSYRIHHPVPDPAPRVSLLVPTRDGLHVLEKCVDSILEKTTYPNYEIIILDNQSREPETLVWFESIGRDPRVRVVAYDHPFNYSAINNFGVRQAHGTVIGLINNDVEVISPDWLTEMVAHACRPDIGCVGAKLYYSDGAVQHGGVILGIGGVAGHVYRHFPQDHPGYFNRLLLTQNLSAVTAACLLVRREVYEQAGGLNEVDLMVALNDVDFCLKVREAGYRNLWTPFAELYHHESVSRGADDTPEKKLRFEREFAYMRRRWARELDADPAYNCNLSRTREDFSLCG
jgi:GT2 family glycosyltransferase